MITPRPLTGTFADSAYDFLTKLEAYVSRVYTDSNGIPTLGVGYAITSGEFRVTRAE